AGLSNNLRSFSDEWNAGFKNATFATIGCPAWMTGVIKGQAGESAAGKWDIAKAPGSGGNWGGSFLAVPKSSKHPKEAAELVKAADLVRLLASLARRHMVFLALGTLTSSLQGLPDPGGVSAAHVDFSNASTGMRRAESAMELLLVYRGPKNQTVRDAVVNDLR